MMRLYLVLQRRFARELLRVYGLAILLTIAARAVHPLSLSSLGILLTALTMLVPTASLVAPILFIQGNASWIRIMPLARKSLLSLVLLFFVTATALGLAAGIFLGLVCALANGLPFAKSGQFLGVALIASKITGDVVIWAGGLAVLSLLLFSWLLSLAGRGVFGGVTPTVYQAPSQQRTNRVIAAVYGGVFVVFVLGYAVKPYVQSGVAIFPIFASFLVLGVSVAAHHLGVCGRSARKWRHIATIVVGFEIVFVYHLAWSQVRSQDYEARKNALEFLNGWARFFGAAERKIAFRQALAERPTLESIDDLLISSDPKELHRDDVEALFRRIKPLTVRSDDNHWYSRKVLGAQLNAEDTLAFLNSDDELLWSYAVLRARYFKDARYIQALISNLPRYREQRKDEALLTLSILTGEYRGYDYYADLKRGSGAKNLRLASFDCAAFKRKAIASLKPSDAGALNVCAREAVKTSDADAVHGIEWRGWLEIPLSSHNKWYVQKAYGMK